MWAHGSTSCLLGIRKSNEHCSKAVSGCSQKNTRKTRNAIDSTSTRHKNCLLRQMAEMSLKRSWPWWMLPEMNTLEFHIAIVKIILTTEEHRTKNSRKKTCHVAFSARVYERLPNIIREYSVSRISSEKSRVFKRFPSFSRQPFEKTLTKDKFSKNRDFC